MRRSLNLNRGVRMKAQNGVKIGGFLICGAVFGFIACQLPSDALHTVDVAITQALAGARTPVMTLFMQSISTLCAPVTLLVICLALMAVYRSKHYSIPIAINLMVSVSLNYTLKNVFLRERPPLMYRAVAETGYSFPSGHAMAAGAFYGFLIYMVAQSGWPKSAKRCVISLLTLLIGLIGFSRVYLGVHYLSDVIAGFAVSIAYLIVYSTVVSLYMRAGQISNVALAQSSKNKRMIDSFAHAFDGVAGGLKGERNMIIHFAMMALVTVFGFLLTLSAVEWLVCVILFGLVIGMELLNTAIETTVDICMPHLDPRARLAKDTAAGAVMAVSIAAAIAGVIIFAPKIVRLL